MEQTNQEQEERNPGRNPYQLQLGQNADAEGRIVKLKRGNKAWPETMCVNLHDKKEVKKFTDIVARHLGWLVDYIKTTKKKKG